MNPKPAPDDFVLTALEAARCLSLTLPQFQRLMRANWRGIQSARRSRTLYSYAALRQWLDAQPL